MNEIEKYCGNKYYCPECGEIATSAQWDEATKIIFGDDSSSIDEEESEECEFICPKCTKQVSGYVISKI